MGPSVPITCIKSHISDKTLLKACTTQHRTSTSFRLGWDNATCGAIYTCHVDDLTFYNSTRAALHVAPNSWADPIGEKYADNFPFLNPQNNTHIYISRFACAAFLSYMQAHMGPEDNFCSTKISKDSVLAKLSDFMWGIWICEYQNPDHQA